MEQVNKILGEIRAKSEGGATAAATIAEQMRELVDSGRLAPGARLPSTGELAGLLGIGRQTAQDALSLLVAMGKIRRRQRLGTFVADRPTRRSVGLLAAVDTRLPLQANFGWIIAQGFVHAAEERGFDHREYIVRSPGGPDRFPESLRDDLMGGRLDVLLVGALAVSIVAAKYPGARVPIRQLDLRTGLSSCVEDSVRWLWRRGCTDLALLLETTGREMLFRGVFEETCRAYGLPVHTDLIRLISASSVRAGHATYDEILGGPGVRPDGLIVMDDMVGLGLIEEAAARGKPLDPSRVVVQVNKGSTLGIPAACPRIEVDWGAVVEHELDRLDPGFDENVAQSNWRRPEMCFRPPAAPESAAAPVSGERSPGIAI